jgi:hypothetical protein
VGIVLVSSRAVAYLGFAALGKSKVACSTVVVTMAVLASA